MKREDDNKRTYNYYVAYTCGKSIKTTSIEIDSFINGYSLMLKLKEEIEEKEAKDVIIISWQSI